MTSPRLLLSKVLLLSMLFAPTAMAGYLGAFESLNKSASFNHQENGIQVTFGSDTEDWLDLEWSFVDYGYSSYDDPTFRLADPSDPDDFDRFEGFLYGNQIVNEETAEFSGIAKLRARGVSAGLKFKKNLTSWLDLYARVSLMAWEAESISLSIYEAREGFDSDGNSADEEFADNINPCGTLDFCRIEDPENPVHTWGVDFWYGYGATIKPFNWLAFRAEYSVITLNAVNFPNAKLESFMAGLEFYY